MRVCVVCVCGVCVCLCGVACVCVCVGVWCSVCVCVVCVCGLCVCLCLVGITTETSADVNCSFHSFSHFLQRSAESRTRNDYLQRSCNPRTAIVSSSCCNYAIRTVARVRIRIN